MAEELKFVKIVPNSFENATRDKRELSVVAEFDCDIIVVAKGTSFNIEIEDGYKIHRLSTRPLGTLPGLVRISSIMSLLTWAYYIRKLRADCISGHDLLGVLIGWMSTWFLKELSKPKIIYDAHEYTVEEVPNASKSKKIFLKYLERFLMKKCVISIMVSDSIAEEVKKIHGLKEKPLVIRNIANYWYVDPNICMEKHNEFCKEMGVPNDTFIMMYHGMVTENRGIEEIIAILTKVKNTIVVILGNGRDDYIENLKAIAEKLDVGNKILFHNAVPIEELWKYVGAADIGLIIARKACQSYYYSLPNKLFENIQSATPLLISDFPEMKKIVEGYNVGLCCNQDDMEDIINKIELLQSNHDMLQELKDNEIRAKEELCWENERNKLREAYRKILDK
jgi:glycosyltransferase involved in cell wall biosynthesis